MTAPVRSSSASLALPHLLQTDLEAYHYQAEQFLHDWICSSEVITYTLKGRAWNANKGAMLSDLLLRHSQWSVSSPTGQC